MISRWRISNAGSIDANGLWLRDSTDTGWYKVVEDLSLPVTCTYDDTDSKWYMTTTEQEWTILGTQTVQRKLYYSTAAKTETDFTKLTWVTQDGIDPAPTAVISEAGVQLTLTVTPLYVDDTTSAGAYKLTFTSVGFNDEKLDAVFAQQLIPVTTEKMTAAFSHICTVAQLDNYPANPTPSEVTGYYIRTSSVALIVDSETERDRVKDLIIDDVKLLVDNFNAEGATSEVIVI